MADSGSVDYKREQRLALLEEKRKKLAEAKLKNATARSPANPTPPSTPIKNLEGSSSSWDDIVATIEAMPASATNTPVKQARYATNTLQPSFVGLFAFTLCNLISELHS